MSRYMRQEVLSEIGEEGQHILSQTHVAVVGCGGLGVVVAPYLAGAGIGEITLIDHDNVELSNLHRQVIYKESDIGSNKAELLANHLQSLNSEIVVKSFAKRIDKENISEMLSSADIVVECTDDVLTKYLVNDYCFVHNVPLVYGSVAQYAGYVSLFRNQSEEDIHIRDFFPIPDMTVPTCNEVGVLGVTPGVIGMLQATEVLKYILGIGELLVGKLLVYNLLDNEMKTIQLKKSFREDMNNVLSKYCYDRGVTVPEIKRSEVSNHKIISLIGDLEMYGLHTHEVISQDNLEPLPDNCIVVCQRGLTSYRYVERYLKKYPGSKIFSLKGGVVGIPEYNDNES